jgi:HEAT repeat protein
VDSGATVVAILALAGPRDERVAQHIVQAYEKGDEPEVVLAAARALGMLGSSKGLRPARDLTRNSSPRLRSLAALALGAIGNREIGIPALEPLLSDPDADVRVSAAQAILQLP